MFCTNCGNNLEFEAKFCPKCGTKTVEESADTATASTEVIVELAKNNHLLINSEVMQANPSFSEENLTDEELARIFIGKKSDYYLKKWSSSKNPGKRSGWNWAAFFFNIIWLAYRKMYKYALIYMGSWLALAIILELLNADRLLNAVGLAIGMALGSTGNSLYYKFSKQNIERYRSSNSVQLPLEKSGGTSQKGLFSALGALIVCGIILAAISSEDEEDTTTASNQPAVQTVAAVKNNNPAEEQKTKAAADAKANAESDAKASLEAEAKKKAEAEAKQKATEDAAKNPKWNTSEVDVLKNGNLLLAINMIKAIKNIPDGEAVSPAQVIKSPWNYYGKSLAFKGVVGDVVDYPPGSDLGKAGIASEVVIECEDGTIADFFVMASSGTIKIDQQVSITGYAVGRTEVSNRVGGKYTHLILVTNKLN